MVKTLYYSGGEFKEQVKGEALATLELIPDGSDGIANLNFNGNVGIVKQRTIIRQSNNLCVSGFKLGSGEMIGRNFKLVVLNEAEVEDKLKGARDSFKAR